jgi:5-methylcytosine-specific restriction endonuclease McrA
MAYQYPFRYAEERTKLAVWQKGRPIPNFDAGIWRHDKYGSVMKYSEHGNTDSKYGWEIDHVRPVARGGGDDLANLQPLYWENNRRKSDSYPY